MTHSVHTASHDGTVGRAEEADVAFGEVLTAMLAVAVPLMAVTLVLTWVAFAAR